MQKEISYKDLKFNPFELIGSDWMLITSGTKDKFNTMTASWGFLGSIWAHGGGDPSAVIFVRPQRYTHQFMEENEYFSLTFFDKKYKKDLAYLGSHSGKDEDKLSKTNIHVDFIDGVPYFNEAKITLILKKVYEDKIKEEGFIDKSYIDEFYPLKDYHTVYIGKIVKVLIDEN